MKLTRRVLFAANTQLSAQLAACNPESRQGLKAKLAAARDERDSLKKLNEALDKRVQELKEKLGETTTA